MLIFLGRVRPNPSSKNICLQLSDIKLSILYSKEQNGATFVVIPQITCMGKINMKPKTIMYQEKILSRISEPERGLVGKCELDAVLIDNHISFRFQPQTINLDQQQEAVQ